MDLSEVDLNVFQANIRSISRNFDQLKVLLTKLNNSFDVIILSGTWNASTPLMFGIHDLKIYHTDSNYN